MFAPRQSTSTWSRAGTTLQLIYHATVRNLRQSHYSPLMGLLMQVLRSATMVLMFLAMYLILGVHSSPIRGDFVLFMMSGVFLFRTHVQAISAVANSPGPASAMMQHAPMTTAISISAAALSSLYQQTFAAVVLLLAYHLAWNPVRIEDPVGMVGMFLLAWATGCAIGLLLMALAPWMPQFMPILLRVFTRANLVFSGKMLVANVIPGFLLPFFLWNPLFHIVDQTRGFMFINYVPQRTSIGYAVWVGLALLVIGMMGEFVTRKHASHSWNARV